MFISISSGLWNLQLPERCQFFQNQFHHLCCVHNCPWYAGLNRANVMVAISAIFKLSTPLAVIVCSHYAINAHFYQLAVNIHGGKTFCPYKQITLSDFLKDFQCHCHCTSTYLRHGIWLTLVPSVAHYPYHMHYLLLKTKWLRLRNVTCWTRLITHNAKNFFLDIYCTDSIYIMYKDKLQNCSCNQFE